MVQKLFKKWEAACKAAGFHCHHEAPDTAEARAHLVKIDKAWREFARAWTLERIAQQ